MQMLALVTVGEIPDALVLMDEQIHPSLRESEIFDDIPSPTSRKSSDANSSGFSPRHVHRSSLSSRRRSTNLSFGSWGNFSVVIFLFDLFGEGDLFERELQSLAANIYIYVCVIDLLCMVIM